TRSVTGIWVAVVVLSVESKFSTAVLFAPAVIDDVIPATEPAVNVTGPLTVPDGNTDKPSNVLADCPANSVTGCDTEPAPVIVNTTCCTFNCTAEAIALCPCVPRKSTELRFVPNTAA